MKLFIALLVVFSILASTFAQEWTNNGFRKYTTLLGVYATQPNELYCSVADNAVGPGVLKSTDYAQTSTFFGPAGALNMDITFTPDNSVSCVVGLGGIFLGKPDSGDYTAVPDVRVVTQNVENFGATGFGVTGSFSLGIKNSVNGVATSTDYGKSWTYSDVKASDPYKYAARFGAFPSESTWYVATGSWTSADAELKGHLLSSKISVEYDHKTQQQLYHFTKNAGAAKGNLRGGDSTGYYGGIFKTTDGGKTFTLVYDTDQQYFNEIHCANELVCMAVGENSNEAYGILTTDGGETWKYALTAPASTSLGAVRMLSEKEIWVGGGEMTPKTVTGAYYHSVDGGETWSLTNFGGMVMDFSFNGGIGYAAYMTPQYNSVAVYK
jgi:hypothetical protein